MLYLKLTPQFKAGPVQALRQLAPNVWSLRARLFEGVNGSTFAAVGGWAAAIGVGAAIMSSASHNSQQAPGAEAPAVAAISTPVAAAPPAPVVAAQAPAPAKTTQRVDMAPLAAIPEPGKLKHKHKKKKDLDSAN